MGNFIKKNTKLCKPFLLLYHYSNHRIILFVNNYHSSQLQHNRSVDRENLLSKKSSSTDTLCDELTQS